MTDFHFNNQGSIILLTPISECAEEWCQTYLPDDCPRWGYSLGIEYNYFEDIYNGIIENNLTIEEV